MQELKQAKQKKIMNINKTRRKLSKDTTGHVQEGATEVHENMKKLGREHHISHTHFEA